MAQTDRKPRFSNRHDGHLIVQTAFLGDLLLSIPLLKNLKSLYPADPLTLVCRKGFGALMVKLGAVDHAIEVDKKDPESMKIAHAALGAKQFGLLICPHESFRSALLARAVKAERKIGFKRWFNRFIFDSRIERPMQLPEALRQLSLISELSPDLKKSLDQFDLAQGARGGQKSSKGELAEIPHGTDMTVPKLVALRRQFQATRTAEGFEGSLKTILDQIDPKKPIVVLAPGSVWRTKMWTSEGFTTVARHHLSLNSEVFLIGTKDERERCEEIAKGAPGARVVAGETSLLETAQLIALADLAVCNDSGAMHLASLGETPTVSVFGPTVLEFGYRPWNSRAVVVQTPPGELKCRPCGKHGSQACPIGTHVCMRAISGSAVIEASKSLSSRES